jgi:hypothetical protein
MRRSITLTLLAGTRTLGILYRITLVRHGCNLYRSTHVSVKLTDRQLRESSTLRKEEKPSTEQCSGRWHKEVIASDRAVLRTSTFVKSWETFDRTVLRTLVVRMGCFRPNSAQDVHIVKEWKAFDRAVLWTLACSAGGCGLQRGIHLLSGGDKARRWQQGGSKGNGRAVYRLEQRAGDVVCERGQ